MRAKPTFFSGRRFRRHESSNARWVNEYAKPSDNKLDSELAEILQTQRSFLDSASWLPPRSDVRATLEKLLKMEDVQQAYAITLVDATTDAILATGALRWYRRRIPAGPLPDEYCRLEIHHPEVRNKIIRLALEYLKEREVDGRRPRSQLDIDFVKQLMAYWRGRQGKEPTSFLNNDRPSQFLTFATDCFHSVGRKLGYEAMIKIISKAKAG